MCVHVHACMCVICEKVCVLIVRKRVCVTVCCVLIVRNYTDQYDLNSDLLQIISTIIFFLSMWTLKNNNCTH